jgi:hypothetical protein
LLCVIADFEVDIQKRSSLTFDVWRFDALSLQRSESTGVDRFRDKRTGGEGAKIEG